MSQLPHCVVRRVAVAALLLVGLGSASLAAPTRSVGTPSRRAPSRQALQRLEAASQDLRVAQQYRQQNPGKQGSNLEQRALDAYNAARAAAYGAPVEPYSASGSFDGSIPEVEPNNDAATAQPLDAALLREGSAVVVGEIRAAGDEDYFAFTAPAGSRVWAYVDTGGAQNPGATTRDSVLTLFNTDGASTLEQDDDDGFGNGRDATVESLNGSAIAGAPLPGPGTYFLRVQDFNNDQILSPYRLYVVLTTATPIAESEPNDAFDTTPDTVLPVGAPFGLVSGSSSVSDPDVFRLALQAGDVVTLQLDEDPAGDGKAGDFFLNLQDPSGANIIGGNDGTDAEAFSFLATVGGIYSARVIFNSLAAEYDLLATVHTRFVGNTSVIQGVLGSGSADYPGISGTQLGRIFRDAVPSNCEAPPKAFPGVFGPSTPHPFDAYLFKNRSGQDACVAVNLTVYDSAQMHSCLYSTFDPGNLQPGYLGDAGSSSQVNGPRGYSVKLPPGAVFVVLVWEPGSGAAGKPYTLTVTGDFRASLVGCPANLTVPNDPNLAGAVVTYNTPGVTDPSLGPVICTPPSGSFFPIGATTVVCRDTVGDSCSFNVTVQDVQPPVVTCPAPITMAQTQANGAVVTFNTTVTDNAPGASVVCVPASGSLFPLGQTIVTCTGTDASGNATVCTFPVTVVDIEAPVITCPDALTVTQTQANGAVVNYAASATDNSGAVTFTSSPASGALFPLGPTIVTCTAADPSGNISTRTFLVTVTDTGAPVISTPGPVTATQDQAGGANVTFNVTATDNSGGAVNVVCTPASGSFFPLGTTVVTCFASDSSGNLAQATFSVTVNAPASTAGVKATAKGTLNTGTPPAKISVNASVSTTGVPRLTFTHKQSTAGLSLKSASVRAITRSGNLVRVFGTLKNGKAGATQEFMLELKDVARPGSGQDTYRLVVRDGFQLAETTVLRGEITIKP